MALVVCLLTGCVWRALPALVGSACATVQMARGGHGDVGMGALGGTVWGGGMASHKGGGAVAYGARAHGGRVEHMQTCVREAGRHQARAEPSDPLSTESEGTLHSPKDKPHVQPPPQLWCLP